ncbi:hypothetical protein [Aurantimonas sp. VKM B-3413]|uniref:hypothetical protein n=1 Tax=Aurantimonas sp. VKM B-3413 TaxID=2779401 RepID=UPI001E4CBBFF|nr:hypothetical protein [Aurantimonas sp. VKM B-3413]MCB8837428.1 hypothetical protein [Aurantimonas sp. VKM B-3413]
MRVSTGIAGMTAAVMMLFAATVEAAPPFPADGCVTYDQAFADGALMTVRPGVKRAHFVDISCKDGEDCPKELKAYLVPGDTVLASEPFRGAFCVYYGAKGRALKAGYMTEDVIQPAKPKAAEISGTWAMDDNTLTFRKSGGGLEVSGAAQYGDNSGELKAPAKLKGGKLTATDGTCTISGRLRGPYLVIDESDNCGGMNVSFMGIYTKR